MKYVKWCLAGVFVLLMLGACASIDQAELVEDNLSEEYILNTYGEISRKNLYFNPEADFNNNIRLYREAVVESEKLSDTEKEQRLQAISDYRFEERRFLTFFFRLKAPAMVRQEEFDFIFKAPSGGSIIEKILMYDNKVTVTYSSQYGSSTSYSYNYVWVLKLRKPFTKDHLEPGTYPFTVVFPNGEELVYQLEI
jgi:hypothetical protein